MKKMCLLVISCILVVTSLLFISGFLIGALKKEPPDVFVGIDVAYNDVEGIKKLVDETSSYTNTFVIGSTGITYNFTKLNDVCNYVGNKDMYFMVYLHPRLDQFYEQRQWVEDAQIRWSEHFLGLYALDETGGRQLDAADYTLIDTNETPANYTVVADEYVYQLNNILGYYRENPIYAKNVTLFTSDYALYWFDYKGGYDVVFAEFGWNYSRQLNVALCRGAATAQNKDWGVMITWTYNNPPYLESGNGLYKDLVYAYDAGAKYILVFDTNENYTQDILKEEHLEALKQFWEYTQNNPRTTEIVSDRVAFVLPKGYGYGFRGPNDKNWGFWEADSFSYSIGENLGKSLQEYGTKLDIIYDDEIDLDYNYSKYVFWNGTIISGSLA
jgi:hypothetical protein